MPRVPRIFPGWPLPRNSRQIPLAPLFQRGEHALETSLFPPLKKGGRGDLSLKQNRTVKFHPSLSRQSFCRVHGWIPAFAGMTNLKDFNAPLFIEPGFCNRREDRDEGARDSFDAKSAGHAGCMDKLFKEENVRDPSSNPAGYCKIRVEHSTKISSGDANDRTPANR